MSPLHGKSRPPRIAQWLLSLVVGSNAEGRSIIGDAQEEFEARGRESRLGSTLWYWGYVARFVITYRRGGTTRQSRSTAPRPSLGQPRASRVQALLWDTRNSVRALLLRPWLSLAVTSTLAIGIGATTLAFALVDNVLLRPLPFPEPEELVDISRVDPAWYGPNPTAAEAGEIFATPAATFLDWERSVRSFTAIGAYAQHVTTFTGEETPERIQGTVVTPGLFEALDVRPALGRYLLPTDNEMGAAPVVVLSDGLWTRRFGADPDVIGRVVVMNGVSTTVIGVMPEFFAFPTGGTEFWDGFDDDLRSEPYRKGGFLHAIGRLAPGISLDLARAELTEINRRLGETYADEAKFITVAFSRQELVVAAVRPGLLLLLGAAAVVLLVGCANVANLLLARVTERKRELALRVALGSGSGRLASLLVSESTLLALVGGAAGSALAWIGLDPLLSALPLSIPRASEVALDTRVLVASLAASLAVGVVLGILPLLHSTRMDINSTLRDGGHGATGGSRSSRSNGLLVVSEVALAVLLLSTSGLFLQSYLASARQDIGFDTEDVLTLNVSLPASRASTPEDVETFYRQLLEEMNAIPGVSSTTLANQMPYAGGYSTPPTSVDTGTEIVDGSIRAGAVTPSFFQTMGIPILQGRGLAITDRAESPPVIVVSERMARRYWPGQSALGKRVRLNVGEDDSPWREVVGVVGSVRWQFGGGEVSEYYRPFSQARNASQVVVLKTVAGAVGVARAAEGAVHALAPSIPVSVRVLSEAATRDRRYRWARTGSLVLAGLSAVATALAILGIYSVMAHGVTKRTREIGIRTSLGASRREILVSVLKGGMLMSLAGVVAGLGLFFAASPILERGPVMLSSPDPLLTAVVVLTVLATSALASLVPAWRAVRIDPMVAFREE